MWTDEEQERMRPNDGDFARAMALTVGLAAADTDMIDAALYESMAVRRQAQMMLAAGELLVRGHELRDNAEALQQWRIQLAEHRSRAEREESE